MTETFSALALQEPGGRGRRVAYEWADCERAYIARRYDRMAGLIGLFDWLLFVPPKLRRLAAETLDLKAGDRVLEIGCGTGRNFPHLHRLVGQSGRIYGVDLSTGMLQRAQGLCEREGWTNVTLNQADAGEYVAPEALDGVIFGLSYNTMPHHRSVLDHAWKQLRPGGRLVIVDAKLPNIGGDLVLPFGLWLMKRTMLGNPLVTPWRDLAEIGGDFQMTEFLFGSYYICRATKPAVADTAMADAAAGMIAAE